MFNSAINFKLVETGEVYFPQSDKKDVSGFSITGYCKKPDFIRKTTKVLIDSFGSIRNYTHHYIIFNTPNIYNKLTGGISLSRAKYGSAVEGCELFFKLITSLKQHEKALSLIEGKDLEKLLKDFIKKKFPLEDNGFEGAYKLFKEKTCNQPVIFKDNNNNQIIVTFCEYWEEKEEFNLIKEKIQNVLTSSNEIIKEQSTILNIIQEIVTFRRNSLEKRFQEKNARSFTRFQNALIKLQELSVENNKIHAKVNVYNKQVPDLFYENTEAYIRYEIIFNFYLAYILGVNHVFYPEKEKHEFSKKIKQCVESLRASDIIGFFKDKNLSILENNMSPVNNLLEKSEEGEKKSKKNATLIPESTQSNNEIRADMKNNIVPQSSNPHILANQAIVLPRRKSDGDIAQEKAEKDLITNNKRKSLGEIPNAQQRMMYDMFKVYKMIQKEDDKREFMGFSAGCLSALYSSGPIESPNDTVKLTISLGEINENTTLANTHS